VHGVAPQLLHMSIDDNTNLLFIFLYEFLCMLSGANHPRLKADIKCKQKYEWVVLSSKS
jgi:hypothetical protein